MTMEDEIAKLEHRMRQAAAEGDAETAALLGDVIARMRAGESSLREQVPGRMGLGSSQEDYTTPGPRPLPRKPDPMVSNHRPGGGRRR